MAQDDGSDPRGAAAVRSLVLAALSLSLMALFARLASARLSSVELVFVRSLFTLVVTWAFLRRAGLSPWGRAHRGLLALRGLLGFAALSCYFYALAHMPLAEATVIQFTAPIFTPALAWLTLGERSAPRLLGAVLLGFSGMLLITRPAFVFGGEASELDAGAIAAALAGAFLMSSAHVLVRRLAPHEHELVIIFYFPLAAVPMSLAAVVPTWVWPDAWEWLLLLALGVAAQSGQVFLTRGLRQVTATGGGVILYLQIVFATLWGVLFLGERPEAWTVGGSLLILGGTLVAARRPPSI